MCDAEDDGCQTFFYTNQQSARLMFYHDHAWGITRLNVYAGEAAGYLITDATEQKLDRPTGAIAGLRRRHLRSIIQDRTFVPGRSRRSSAAARPDLGRRQLGRRGQPLVPPRLHAGAEPGRPVGHERVRPLDVRAVVLAAGQRTPSTGRSPTRTTTRPASSTTRDLDVPADPFCEPALIPGTPNISVGMEQFNDTPIVNGTAYPTTTVDPKTYRLPHPERGQRPVLEPASGTSPTPTTGHRGRAEAAEVAAAQTDPNVFPTPDTTPQPAPARLDPDRHRGRLPAAPVVVAGHQPTTWITDPTRFDVGNVDKHSLLLAPAERADVVVDFSKYAGKTLILYNDAPAAFPARVAGYDYYTGDPDLQPDRRSVHPARLRPEHPDHHAGQGRRRHSGAGRST